MELEGTRTRVERALGASEIEERETIQPKQRLSEIHINISRDLDLGTLHLERMHFWEQSSSGQIFVWTDLLLG